MNIVIVLGVGRSGTSLLMQVLESMGIALPGDLISKHAANRFGSKEDQEIFNIQQNLMESLGVTPQLPLPEAWDKTRHATEAQRKLESVIQKRINENSVFAFKDPKTNSFLPIWNKVFNKLRIVPIYILTTRTFIGTASSFKRQYGSNIKDIEATWLCRNVDALFNTGLDCYVLHYEDWFDKPEETFASLRSYIESYGVATNDVDLKRILNTSSDHSSIDDINSSNTLVQRLENALQLCHGSNFDRNLLSEEVKYCKARMMEFKSWADLAVNATLRRNAHRDRLEKLQKTSLNETDRRLTHLNNELKSASKDIDRICKLDL